jgi:hypothetical protein
MRLPPELAMEIGSYLTEQERKTCTYKLSRGGLDFVSGALTDRTNKLMVDLVPLIDLCRAVVPPSIKRAKLAAVAQQMFARIEFYVSRCPHVEVVILFADIRHARHASIYSNLQQEIQSLRRANGDQFIVQWHVLANHVPAGDAFAPLHTLDLRNCRVADVSGLASCPSMHTLDLGNCKVVVDLSALASCPLLHTLNLSRSKVTHVSALASCPLLHTLNLSRSKVKDVSALASRLSLHTLDLSSSKVKDVSALALCPSLHTLDLSRSKVKDVSALASCPSLHTLDLSRSNVTDVSALASCPSLHTLDLRGSNVTDVSALASCPSLHTLNLRGSKVTDGWGVGRFLWSFVPSHCADCDLYSTLASLTLRD